MPVVEIVWWSPSEAFEADKSIIIPALDFLKSTDGCNAYAATITYLKSDPKILKSVYSGFAEEEKTHFLFLVWETLQHHQNLIAHPEYPQVTRLLPTVGEGGIKLYHVEFNKDFLPAISAPSTEILAMTLKEGKTKDELYTILGAIASNIDKDNTPEHRHATFGPTVEDPTKFYLSIGWKSAAFHGEIVQQPHIFAEILKLRETVNYKLLHVNFAKH